MEEATATTGSALGDEAVSLLGAQPGPTPCPLGHAARFFEEITRKVLG